MSGAASESRLYVDVNLTRSGCLRIFYLLNSSDAENYLRVEDPSTGNLLWSAQPSEDGRWQWGTVDLPGGLTEGFRIKARNNAGNTSVGIAAIKATLGTCQKGEGLRSISLIPLSKRLRIDNRRRGLFCWGSSILGAIKFLLGAHT